MNTLATGARRALLTGLAWLLVAFSPALCALLLKGPPPAGYTPNLFARIVAYVLLPFALVGRAFAWARHAFWARATHELLDAQQRPVDMPKDRVVPPELAPPGLPIRRIVVPPPAAGPN